MKSKTPLSLVLDNRVDIALRYASSEERKHIAERLEILKWHDPENISIEFKSFVTSSSRKTYLLRVSDTLRAIFWYPGDGTVVVEDLVSAEVLSRHFARAVA